MTTTTRGAGSPYDFENSKVVVQRERNTVYLVYGFGGLIDEFEDYDRACDCYREQKDFGMAKMSRKVRTVEVEVEETPRWYHNW